MRQMSVSPWIRGSSKKVRSQYEATWLVKVRLGLALLPLWIPHLPRCASCHASLSFAWFSLSLPVSVASWSNFFGFFSGDHQSWMTHSSNLQILSFHWKELPSAFIWLPRREKYFHIARAGALGYRKADSPPAVETPISGSLNDILAGAGEGGRGGQGKMCKFSIKENSYRLLVHQNILYSQLSLLLVHPGFHTVQSTQFISSHGEVRKHHHPHTHALLAQ